jgi:glycosyltransferase involved in cell wall biosynthesis
MKKLSIIIPTLGRKEELFNTITDLSRQSLSRNQWEVIVVIQDQPDIEAFKKRLEEWSLNFRLFFCAEPNASLARNIGIQESRGEYLLFLDDDLQIKNPDYLKNLLSNFENEPHIPGVYGQVLDPGVPPRESRHKWSYKKNVGWLFFPPNYNKKCNVQNGTSANLSVRKAAAIDAGGMDINFEKGAHREESDFCLRLTKKYGPLVFDPSASVIHLGAAKGGCRNWGKNEGIHPVHHVFGEWYFILKGLRTGTIKWHEMHYHLGVLFFRQIWNQANKQHPGAMFKALGRSISVFFIALKKAIKAKKNVPLVPANIKYKLILEHEF